MLTNNNQLSAAQLEALDRLAADCRAVDGDLPPLYTHILEQKRLTDNNFLYLENDHLIGFLSVYFFYTNACEISLIVSPAHRRQGVGRQLLEAVLPLLVAKQVETLLFSTPATANKDWFSGFGLHYKNSEYHMERKGYEPIFMTKHALTFRKATEDDVPDLCSIDEQCFPVEPEDLPSRFLNLIDDNLYTLIVALKDNKIVGKAHIRWEDDEVLFSDIAVTPAYQSQGFGSELLAYCINHALTLGNTKLALDVETSNYNALKLYTHHGFKSVNAIDFWAITTEKLAVLLTKGSG